MTFPELVPQEELDATYRSKAMLTAVLFMLVAMGMGAAAYTWMHDHNAERIERLHQ